ncbi:O-antigen translocase [Flavivirga aquimarina]|uniref:O-antigen translocase n=1 Tax=Flavivirga aquimarina TaxID=2027862 RepID=A0ABT8WCP3_9FLAO|nr:O-antigen translocase [Flavivirga aquimarina]MDO5970922.1 O-antigen translocase [Flavivirga aquimarina]
MLLKVTSANTMLVLVRMGFSLISQKALAILIGADGIAQVGNLKNIVSFFEQFSVLGTSNGLIKYISEYKDDKKQLSHLFSTAFVFAAFASIFSFIILFFLSDVLNGLVFGIDNDYVYIFKILSFIIPFMGINAILNSLLNGVSAYKLFSKVNLFTIVVSTIIIVSFTFKKGTNGSLLAISLVPLIQFFGYLLMLSKKYKKHINLTKLSYNLYFKNKLMSYSFMTVIVILFINISEVAIRRLIEDKVSVLDAGYWTAMTSVSKTYMQFSAAIFPLYILPKYAKINDTFGFRREVKKIYKMLLPLIVIGMFLVFLFRDLIINVLYTEEFLSMSGLFKWQLMGDLIKFSAIVISYQFLAKKQIINFVFTEILSVLLFYGFSVYFVDYYGTEGIVIAHFVRYVLYFLVVLYILRHSFIGQNKLL